MLDYLRNEPIVDSRVLVKKYGLKHDHARQVLSRMSRDSMIERIQGPRKGVYCLSQPDRNRSCVRLDDYVPKVGYHEGPYGFWYTSVPLEWVRRLGAPVVNRRTQMRQIGWKLAGNPCSAQFERSGGVRVYPHEFESVWRPWLQRELIRFGWGMDEAKAFDGKLTHALRQVEIVGPQLPQSVAERLPAVIAVPGLGLTLKVDNTPVKNTLELGVNVQGLERFLGIGELKADHQDFKNEVWTVLGAFKENIESHLVLVKTLTHESTSWRAVGENTVRMIRQLEAVGENTVRMISKLEGLVEALTERLNGLNGSKAAGSA